MKKIQLGALEELILLTVMLIEKEAYGVRILNEIYQRTGKRHTIGSIHSSLIKLEEKGFIDSNEGGATKERGGRRKRYFKPTPQGFEVLVEIKQVRDNYYSLIPAISK